MTDLTLLDHRLLLRDRRQFCVTVVCSIEAQRKRITVKAPPQSPQMSVGVQQWTVVMQFQIAAEMERRWSIDMTALLCSIADVGSFRPLPSQHACLQVSTDDRTRVKVSLELF